MQTSVQVGDVLLNKYRVERVLGEGGMGYVLSARHLQLDELFAIKLMHKDALGAADAVARFLREARAAARLKGEHVARVHDVGHLDDGSPYMVMEQLAGEDLSDRLRRSGVLPVDEAVLYVIQACEAIAEAHANDIVHRDIKPSNVFLTQRANGTPCVKVLDFGISKRADSFQGQDPALTKTGAVMGSPAYMAPEQMVNSKTVDGRADIWALGAMLYELTTGRIPFQGDSMTELVARVMSEPPMPPTQLQLTIPAELNAIILRCLEKKPDSRFQSVRDLMAALHPFLGQYAPLVPVVAGGVMPARASIHSLPFAATMGATHAAWGTTNPTPPGSDKKKRVFIVAAVAASAASLLVLILVIMQSGEPATTSAASAESAAVAASTPPPETSVVTNSTPSAASSANATSMASAAASADAAPAAPSAVVERVKKPPAAPSATSKPSLFQKAKKEVQSWKLPFGN